MERKTKPAETQADNIWRSRHNQVAGSAQLGRAEALHRGSSNPAPNYKDRRGQEKNRLLLLTFITKTQPSAMVWGKSWKCNKSLPPAEGPTAGADWGQCWMFATQQPYSDKKKPRPNGPNMVDPHSLHLWKEAAYRVVESKQLDLSLFTEEWQMSWRKCCKSAKKEDSPMNQENIPKNRLFSLLVESQHHNETLCSSEWRESWHSNKPAGQQEHFTASNEELVNESVARKHKKETEESSRWEECWRLVNHHDCNKSKSPQHQNSHSREWVNSWRAAMVAFSNCNNSASSLTQGHSDTYDDYNQQITKYDMLVCRKQRNKALHLCSEFNGVCNWSKSWQVTKNNSKPSEEMEKVLNALPPQMDTPLESLKIQVNTKEDHLSSQRANPDFEQVKHNVIFQSNKKFNRSKNLLLNNMVNVFSSQWEDSWKTLKHRMRMEKRPDPLRPFRESENRQDMRFSASEWINSRMLTCQSLCQELESWHQSWSTTPQIRVERASPTNGPTVEQTWRESWKISRHQHQSKPGQHSAKNSQGRSNTVCHQPYQTHLKYIRSICDWQVAWMVSETQFHHDKPSLTQWMNAWKLCNKQVSKENWVDELEIHTQKEKFVWQRSNSKISQLFDNQLFREIYPDKEWGASSRVGPLLNQQHYGSPGAPGKSISSATKQKHTSAGEQGLEWGRSFRLSNPMLQMEQPEGESLPNPHHYTVMWSLGNNIQNKTNTSFNNNPANFRLWGNSHKFLQGAAAQIKGKGKSKEPTDPWVIITKKTKCNKHLYNIEKEKQSERKWAGCHVLGKTQPRPNKCSAPLQKNELQEKFFEEWAESWRFLDSSGNQKRPKSLLGWSESWKFLPPLYQPVNSSKAK